MKTALIEINLFSLSELEKTPKSIAISDHKNFLISQGMDIENDNGEMENIPYNPTNEEVIENIELNDYLYYKNGELADCTTYTSKQEKVGKTFYNFQNKEYLLK